MLSTKVGPVPIVVIRGNDGGLYGLVDKCLHMGGPLSKGATLPRFIPGSGPGDYRYERENDAVRCPWHGYEYDITTGRMVVDPTRCLRTFEVVEEDGRIVVEL